MAKNRVKCQKGMSEAQFLDLYGTEEQCRAALLASRWPNGFRCPACGGEVCSEIASRRLYQCSDCRRQVSLTAGTILHASKLPLTQWYRAMYHLGQCKNGISALELSRRLGVAYNTAWMLHHKLMQVMVEREEGTPLAGAVHVDDAYVGGARAFTGSGPAALRARRPETPSRPNVQRQWRTLSGSTENASAMRTLDQPSSDSSIARARSASARSDEEASPRNSRHCSAVATTRG